MIDLNVSRRTFLQAGGAFAALGVAGCSTTAQPALPPIKAEPVVLPTAESEMYGALPLGARALYIFRNGEDTLYRIHGSPEWWTIGKSVSSGCVRMLNQDAIDLYSRVPNRTEILVIGSAMA